MKLQPAPDGHRPDIREGFVDPRLDPRLYDFKAFLWLVWRRLGLPDPTPVQKDFADFLQHGADPGRSPWEAPNSRLFIAGYRCVGKSWIASTFAVWLLACDQSLNVMIVSGNQDRAADATKFCQRLVEEIPEIAYLIPQTKTRWSGISFDVAGAPASHAPSMKAKSVSGMLVGSRADVLIPDDVETPQNSETQHQREKLEKWCGEFEAILKAQGRIVYLGTYQSQDSYYYKLPEKGFSPRVIPIKYPQPEKLVNYAGTLSPRLLENLAADPELAGQPTDPTRFGLKTIEERSLSMGRSMAELQLMLNPELSDLDRYPLKLGDLVILDCDPKLAPERVVWSSAREQVIEDLANPGFIGDRLHSPMRVLGDWLPYTGSLLSVDPAGGGSDELVALVTKVLNGQIFLLAGYATTKKPDEPEFEAVARLAAEHEVNMVLVEDNFGDGMFTQLLMPYLRRIYRSKDGRGCQVESIKNYGMTKEKRMLSALEPLMNAHKLCVSKDFVRWDRSSAPGNDYTLLFQMSRLQPIKGALIHDDRLDCLALAARYWNEQGVTATDSRERMIARAAERWDDDEITESTNWLDTFSL